MRLRAFLLLVSLPLAAQQSELSPRAAAAPEASKSFISLDVVVTDKAGKPVSGLEQQDFNVIDNKQPRKIASFRAVDPSTAPPTEVVILLDALNAPFADVAIQRQELEAFLAKNASTLPGPTTIVMMGDLGVALGAASARDAKDLVAAMNAGRSGKLVAAEDIGAYGVEGAQQVSLYELDRLADFEAAKPGRKLVIWISPGWPLLAGDDPDQGLNSKEQKALFGTIVSLSDKLRRGRVSIYDIDPAGLADADRFGTSDYKQFEKGVKSAGQTQVGSLGLQILSDQTGGRVLNSSNDIAGELEKCLADAKVYYTITFDAPKGDGPNELHTLDVRICKSGLTARTRMMYYAQP
ncbi:MAG TPA: VWA domain-containing protein [Bryobacteraceae bacterium]|nr:VWA domain-containing protein [Bryobacteraceae bacterium]